MARVPHTVGDSCWDSPRGRAGIVGASKDPKVALGERLGAAAARNDAELVESLLQERADPNHIHYEVSFSAPLARTSSAAVARALVRHPDVDINWCDCNDISILESVLLFHSNDLELLEAVLQHPHVDVHRRKTLRTAARFTSAALLRALLDRGADVNAGVLHHAISRTSGDTLEVVGMLMQRPGLDINARIKGGAVALHFLSKTDSLVFGGNVSEGGLRRKAASRQVTMLPWLLQMPGLEPNAEDEKGCTPLHAASKAGRVDIVRAFLHDGRFDASVWWHDAAGLAPLERAVLELEKPREPVLPLRC